MAAPLEYRFGVQHVRPNLCLYRWRISSPSTPRCHRDFFGFDGELDVAPIKAQAGASRVYFYDAIDYSLHADENESQHQARVEPLEGFFAYIRSLSGFHVRPGTVRTGRKKAREQKEVDVLLAVDMMAHGFNGTMSTAVLISGDVDFRPVVEELIRHGVFVDVWYERRSIAEELADAADFGHEIPFRQMYSWNSESFREAHPIPDDDYPAEAPHGELIKVGSTPGASVELRRSQNSGRLILWIIINTASVRRIIGDNLELLEKYVEFQYGVSIEWNYHADEIQVSEQNA